MSKKVLGIGLSVLAFAVPFVGPVLGTAIGIGALAGTALLATGIAIASSVLLGPATPRALKTNPQDRLHASLDPTTPRKIAFGVTAGATDVTYR